jgi:hypothetical protein
MATSQHTASRVREGPSACSPHSEMTKSVSSSSYCSHIRSRREQGDSVVRHPVVALETFDSVVTVGKERKEQLTHSARG